MIEMPVEERLAIQELTHKYSMFCDTFQLEKLMDLFTDDAVFDESPFGASVCTGKAELREYFSRGFEGLWLAHYISNGLINEYSGDEARGTCFVHAEVRLRSNNKPWQLHGYYDDHYVKIDGQWRFKNRVVIPLIKPDDQNFL